MKSPLKRTNRKTQTLIAIIYGLIALAPHVKAQGTEAFLEMENFICTDGTWVQKDHIMGNYSGEPSRAKMLWGGSGTQGSAIQTFEVTSGITAPHRVWVRFLKNKAPGERAPFLVSISQESSSGPVVMGSGTLDTDTAAYTTNRFAWESFLVSNLVPGEAKVTVTKVQRLVNGNPVYSSGILSREVDCLIVTSDTSTAFFSNTTPIPPDKYMSAKMMEHGDPLWIKVQMGATQSVPVAIHFWGTPPRLDAESFPPSIPHTNIYSGSMAVPQNAPASTGLMTAGQSSQWFNITPVLRYIDPNMLKVYALKAGSNTPEAGADFSVLLATGSSSANPTIINTFTRSGTGSGMYLDVDLLNPSANKSDLDHTQASYDAVMALPATPGKRPGKFPYLTGDAVDPGLISQASFANEVGSLLGLGFNGRGIYGYNAAYYNAGLTKLIWSINHYNGSLLNGDKSSPDIPLLTSKINSSRQTAINSGKHNEAIGWLVADEPNSMSMDHIASCPTGACVTKFRQYLAEEGVPPSTFGPGLTDYSTVFPSNNKADRERYYYTALFRCRIMTDLFKMNTDILSSGTHTSSEHTTYFTKAPPTYINIAEEWTYFGNVLQSGIDPFDLYGKQALNMGWCEDWLSYSATYQVTGYRADILRSACSVNGQPFGMYNIIREMPWDIGAKAATAIGHGSQAVWEYNWGPGFSGNDNTSTRTELYPALKELGFAIGEVEDYLVGATVPKAKIAILYSHATDVWSMEKPWNTSWTSPTIWNVLGKDRIGLYLLLRHLGFPVEIVTEQDVIDGKLDSDNYEMVIANGANMRKDAKDVLVDWLEAGGTLYLGAGALDSDEFNRPLGFDAEVGITRAAYTAVQNCGREYYEFPNLTNQKPVTMTSGTNSYALESLCGYQKVTSMGGGSPQVLATFNEDSTPAAFTKTVGSGTLKFTGFHPGLAYQKQAVITMRARKIADPVYPTYGSTNWPAAYRLLFANFIGNLIVPPVTVTNSGTMGYLVEANRIENSGTTSPGSVITISNYTGTSLSDVQISFPRNGKNGTPKSVINPITSHSTTSGTVTVTMDVSGSFDFIVLPDEDIELSPPTVEITSPTNGSVYGSPQTINITANPSDLDGLITKVQFYNHDIFLGQDVSSSGGWTFTWDNVQASGTNGIQLTAVAYDNDSYTGTSTAKNITVNDSDLRAYWKLNETTGNTAADSSGNGYAMTVYGYNPAVWGVGKIQNSITLADGTNRYATKASGMTLPGASGDQTISFWFLVTSIPISGTKTGLAVTNGSTETASGINIGFKESGGMKLGVWRNSDKALIVSTGTLPSTGTWHHVAYTKNGSNSKLFIDGVQVDIASGGTDTGTAKTVTAGRSNHATSPNYLGGKLDEIRIYSRALSATEIAALALGSQ